MLDEKLSCLLDESEDELNDTNDTTYKNEECYLNEKNIRNDNCKNSSSSLLNFNIRNLGNLDAFFKISNDNKNLKQNDINIRNNNLNENTPFYNVGKKKDENNSDNNLNTNDINDNEKNILNTELKKKHAQLKANSLNNFVNIKNVKCDEINKYTNESYTYLSPNKKKISNFENKSKNENALSNTLNNVHNDEITTSCKINENHNESECKKKDMLLQKEKGYLLKEKDNLEKNKEEMVDNIIYERNNFSETYLYKENFNIGEIKKNNALKEKNLSNNIKKNDYKNSENNNIDLSDQTFTLIDTNNESNNYIRNNEILKENSFNYSDLNLNEMFLKNSKSCNSFNSCEFNTNEKNKKRASILNSNSTKSNSLIGPAGLQHKIKKYGNTKSKELIYCFSFIKYGSWIKGLQILNLPLDPFHLSINSHKYIYDNPSNGSFLYKYNIHTILNNKKFFNYRIERMMVIVKSIICRNHGYFLVVMDPSGQMPASLHKEVESEYKKKIDIGCTLLLRDVTVFDTIDNFPYLIVTLRSLVRVIKSEETDYVTKEKIFNGLKI
ncbi:conserved Plasmodium protein, unknown function [Plasmodium gallinaceum]|uniref:Homologous recombination OB-fold protein OB-fold domain-containing protein n=1 Tax=Plasmodium gallinaceum TaxID=5849 RepID=A0A1J1GN11_PLAGA|nr:conserved Plasmodium protein, unknown function [Plasmodium gallinaceum]CRG93748.1 conserved Plasmodium protein, unknown function [Plasmodium gallinaceum]